MKDPTLSSMITVGGLRFRKGTKIETAQDAIDRLHDRYSKLDKIVWRLRQLSERLPQDLQQQISEFYGRSR